MAPSLCAAVGRSVVRVKRQPSCRARGFEGIQIASSVSTLLEQLELTEKWQSAGRRKGAPRRSPDSSVEGHREEQMGIRNATKLLCAEFLVII